MQPDHNGLFGRIAVHLKFITPEQLRKGMQIAGRYSNTKRIGSVLVEMGWMTDDQVDQVLRSQRQYEQQLKTKQNKDESQASGGGKTIVGMPQPVAEQVAPRQPQPAPPVQARAVKQMDQLLLSSVRYGASDLHVHVGHPLILRLNGQLVYGKPPVYKAEDTERLLLEILTPKQREQLNKEKEVSFAYDCMGQLRVRAAYCQQQRGGIDGVFRIIPIQIPTIESLGLPRDIARFSTYHQGLVLFTGPTGCGKTTTLAALVNAINIDRKEHIITVEDPIEFIHKSKSCLVRQRQVRDHTVSFEGALRAALREDPDIIVVGELVDRETMSLAITAAETGHLVYGTLHTNNAVRTINRILDVFPPEQVPQIRSMVSSSLRGVISQRLLPTVDGKRRVPALEVLPVTVAVSNLIREGKMFQIPAVMQLGRSTGMRLLDDSLEEHLKQGTITNKIAMEHAEDPKRFRGGEVSGTEEA